MQMWVASSQPRRLDAADPFMPWKLAVRRGMAAARQGQVLLALVSFQQSLGIARELLAGRVADHHDAADEHVAALVVSHHNIADLQSESGLHDLAAAHLAEAHEALMRLLCIPGLDPLLRQAALRHSRETHAGLLRHIGEHGDHPCLARALRAGCLVLSAASPTLH